MTTKSWVWTISIAASIAASAWAGTIGKVIPIGGMASDLALDENRGVLYVANFTANRVEVVSLSDNSVQRSMNVASQPSSLAISPDGKYLVVAHFGNNVAPAPPSNALTVINLDTNERQTFALGAAPLGVAFGNDGKALIATATEFLSFDPQTGGRELIDTITGVAAKTLPQPANSFPPSITSASMAASRDGSRIYGQTDTLNFGYDVATRHIQANIYTAAPPMAPRVVSVNQDGSAYTAGWALWDGNLTLQGRFSLMSEFPGPSGDLNVGTHAIDTSRNLIYSQVPLKNDSRTAILKIVDAENLAVRETLQLPENFTGKSVLTNDNNMMYGVSESGILVLPVGSMDQVSRIFASQEDVVFRGNFCSKQTATQEITITDVSGAATDFSIKSNTPGVTVFPTGGTTPARIRIAVDPSQFTTQKGTVSALLTIQSSNAANIPAGVRVLFNNKEPDQRGAFVNVPGKLVDLIADPVRNRFYVLRQDTNEVLVFDAATNTQVAKLKTGNTPTQLAFSFDKKNLLVGSDDSQLLYVFDLDTLQPSESVRMPAGHYPRSVAAAGSTVLTVARVAGGTNTIDRVDMATLTATELPRLGVFANSVDVNTTLIGSPNGSSIMAAQANGNVLLYNAAADTFTISRKLAGTLAGAYAASNYDQFVIGNQMLNASLVPTSQLGSDTLSTGFAFVDQTAYRASAANASSPGMLQRFDPKNISGGTSARIVEAPVQSDTNAPFTRTLAPLANRTGIVALTTSGITVLPWNYDANVAPPRVDRVVNSADFSSQVAPNGLVSIMGSNLNSVNQAFSGGTSSLQDSCIQVNGVSVPVLFVSPTQINAQIPPVDSGTLRLATPGGVVDNIPLNISATAPAIFRVTVPGLDQSVPAIVRASNNTVATLSNPIHRGDVLVIYATGLGHTNPDLPAGTAAPSDTLTPARVTPTITIGGVAVEVLFAGLTPGQIGVYQINVKVYGNVPLGIAQSLVITQGGGSTSASVRVVD